jgi:ferredoxin
MANKYSKTPGNAPGAWYVDDTCVDCDLCRANAGGIFDRNAEIGMSIVIRQPLTPEEIHAAKSAMDACPTESIGNDGN